jgi:hypothetical protein
MTANVTPVMSEVPYARELSAEELGGVSGGWFCFAGGVAARVAVTVQGSSGGLDAPGGQNDPAQMFQQIMQQLTAG